MSRLSHLRRAPGPRGAAGARARVVGGAATAVLAALSLAACGSDGDSGRSAGAPANTTAAATVPSATTTGTSAASSPLSAPSTGSPDASTGSGSGTGHGEVTTGGAAKTHASGSAASSGKPVTCEGSVTRTVAAPLIRPVDHLLLTVTNTGSRTCYLYGYPALRFGSAQSVPPPIAASHPQAVVTLDPGESGYASVRLSAGDGSAAKGRTEKSLTVFFSGRSGAGSVGAGAHPPLPAGGVHVDGSLTTTYWQSYVDDALNW